MFKLRHRLATTKARIEREIRVHAIRRAQERVESEGLEESDFSDQEFEAIVCEEERELKQQIKDTTSVVALLTLGITVI